MRSIESTLCLIFVVFDDCENFLTTKISRITEYHCVLEKHCLIEHLTLTNSCAVIDTSTSGEQSAGSSDSIWIVWMLLFILFALLTIVAVMIIIYLAYLLKKRNKSKVDSKAGNDALVQTNSVGKRTYELLLLVHVAKLTVLETFYNKLENLCVKILIRKILVLNFLLFTRVYSRSITYIVTCSTCVENISCI